jgi:hypothetical protein
VGCGALGSLFAGAAFAAGLAGLCIVVSKSHCGATQRALQDEVLTVPGLNRPKNELIALRPRWAVEATVGAEGARALPGPGALPGQRCGDGELEWR